MKYVYWLLFVFILIFVAACDLTDCEPGCPGCISAGRHVLCEGGKAVLYTTDNFYAFNVSDSAGFNPNDYDCSDGTPKPKSGQGSSGGSQQGTENVANPNSSAAANPAASPQRGLSRNPIPHAEAPPQSFLPRTVLALPLGAISTTNVRSQTCDSSQQDVLQVASKGSKLARIGTCPLQMKAAIPVASRPQQVVVTPDGSTALVTSFDNAVNFVDLASNRVSFTLQTGQYNPSGVAVSPDGLKAYITSFNATYPALQIIDMATRTITDTIPLSNYPQSVFLTPDGSQAWVTYPQGPAVFVVDLLSKSVATTIGISSSFSIAFNSTGTRAYVASQSGAPGIVAEVDTGTYEVVKSYTVGTGPLDIAVPYGDRLLIVTNTLDNSISSINLSRGVVNTTKIGGAPKGIATVR